jgi:hypothetical protein
MLTQTFQHEDATYTLRERIIFDEEMRNAAWIDLGNAVAKAHDLEKLGDLPLTIQNLTRRYVEWMQVTTITPCPDYAKISVYSADVNAFDQWMDAILADGQALAVKWSNTYEALTSVEADEKKASGESANGHESEPSPNAATSETN